MGDKKAARVLRWEALERLKSGSWAILEILIRSGVIDYVIEVSDAKELEELAYSFLSTGLFFQAAELRGSFQILSGY